MILFTINKFKSFSKRFDIHDIFHMNLHLRENVHYWASQSDQKVPILILCFLEVPYYTPHVADTANKSSLSLEGLAITDQQDQMSSSRLKKIPLQTRETRLLT
jgi:hypothetical protein